MILPSLDCSFGGVDAVVIWIDQLDVGLAGFYEILDAFAALVIHNI
jgi:hypothetical protein